jgi:membrane protease YdiL (CAAX protease family)
LLSQRLAKFLRSVVPADPWQLVYLLGAVFLFVSPRLSWWSSDFLAELQQFPSSRAEFSSKLVLCILPVSFAGPAGYFICFWPGKNPVRRILGFVVGPAIIGLGLFLYRIPFFLAPYTSVIEPGVHMQHKMSDFTLLLWKYSPGFCFCAAGLLLIALFTFRLATGRSSLPLSLSSETIVHTEDPGYWQKIKLLIWTFLGAIFILYGLLFGTIFLALQMGPWHNSSFMSSPWFRVMDYVLQAVVFIGVALMVVGKEGLQIVRRLVQLPEPRLVLLGLLLPLGIFLLLPTAAFLFDYIQWAAHDFGKSAHPIFGPYIQNLPNARLLWVGLPALAEEIVFRGLLQSSMVRRYGLYAGVFLTNLTWGAFHFRGDVYSGKSVGFILLELVSRILFCLALGYVLSWLTLHSGSIWPAAVAHTVSNMLVFASFGMETEWGGPLRILFWAILAIVLFRFWPVTAADEPAQDAPVTSLEPAV